MPQHSCMCTVLLKLAQVEWLNLLGQRSNPLQHRRGGLILGDSSIYTNCSDQIIHVCLVKLMHNLAFRPQNIY